MMPESKNNGHHMRFLDLAPAVALLTLVAIAYVVIAYLVAVGDGSRQNRTPKTAPSQTVR